MAHGHPTGYARLYDADGNAVDVVLLADATRGIVVKDEMLRREVAALRKELRVPEPHHPWAMDYSPWKGLS